MKQSATRFSYMMTRRTAIRLIGTVPWLTGGLLTACSSAPLASRVAASPTTPAALAPGGTLDHFAAQQAAQNQFSGTLLVARGDQPVLLRAYGWADQAQHVPNRLDTIYALGSVTKSFTAVAIMQLVEQGKLSVQDHLGKHLDGFPPAIANTVTIRQLLTHTSGMGNYQLVPEYQKESQSWSSAAQTMTGLLNIIRQQPLLFTPGTRYSYSNSGYVTLGWIVQQVSGQSYYDYVPQHIFQVAGMSRSDFYTKPQRARNPQIAHPYARVGTPFLRIRGPHAPKPGSLIDGSQGPGGFIGAPDGDAYSTVEDMLQYNQALQTHRLLNAASTNLLMTSRVSLPEGKFLPWHQSDEYTYGLNIGRVNGKLLVWHNGGGPGTAAQFDMYPTLGWTAVVLSNYDPDQNFTNLAKEEEELVTQA